ncbi:MAG: leucyl/phenylalanyl-tRNA--protein transferase [Planctomycetota bacterium]
MRGRRRQPVFLDTELDPLPDPRGYDSEGLVAVGGDLSEARLREAYGKGVFPWYAEGILPMWWSPDPRALMTAARLHVSRSLQRRLRRDDFTVTWNRCFARVMAECGRFRAEGTWIIPEMLRAYEALHRRGAAHSLEVWHGRTLVGGIYGVQLGGLFAAESMFHRATDMSKVALVALVRSLFAAGIELFDVQMLTPHLASMGAFEVPRADYLARLPAALTRRVVLVDPPRSGSWRGGVRDG